MGIYANSKNLPIEDLKKELFRISDYPEFEFFHFRFYSKKNWIREEQVIAGSSVDDIIKEIQSNHSEITWIRATAYPPRPEYTTCYVWKVGNKV